MAEFVCLPPWEFLTEGMNNQTGSRPFCCEAAGAGSTDLARSLGVRMGYCTFTWW